MQDLLKTILTSDCSRIDAILHVGAGTCRELGDFLSLGPGRIMLVEADPQRAAALARAVRGISPVEVVNAAVAPADGQAAFWLVNNARESSLHRPAHLLTRYPNLRVVRSVTVPALTLTQLAERLVADPEGENLLVLELQGAELSVLAATARQVLWQFSWIAIRASAEPLYEDGARLEDVARFMAKSGFLAASPLEADAASPFQEILFRRDNREIRLHELTRQVAEQEQAIGVLRQDLANQQSENASLAQTLQDQSRFGEGLRTKLAEADRERSEQARSIDALKAENEAAVNHAASLGQQINKAGEALTRNTVEMQRLAREREENLKQVAVLKREKTSLEERLATSARAYEALHGDKAALAERIKTLQEGLATSARASVDQTRLAQERGADVERLRRGLAACVRQIAGLQEHVAALETRLAEAIRSCDDQSQLAEARRSEIERLASEHGAHAERATAFQQRITTLETQLAISMKSHEDQSRLAEERRREVERLAREQGASPEQANGLRQRIGVLETQLAASLKSSEDQFRLAEERRLEMERLASERDRLAAELAQLEGERSELDHRQRLLDDEMVKAEAQIDLIKDVLLREKAL